MAKNWFETFLTAVILIGITTILYLYTAGYRLNRNEDNKTDFTQTGMISAKSIPEGANVYIDGILRTATNDTISSINPGVHNLKIAKNGFVVWEKDIEVFPELVTDVTAVLISKSSRLEPLTNTGAKHSVISPSLSKLAFFSNDGRAPGVWVIPLTDTGLNLFRSNPYVVLEDTARMLYSKGTSIEWSPDEKALLVEGRNNDFFLIDLDSNTAESTASPDLVRETWTKEVTEDRIDFIEKLDIPKDLRIIATSSNTNWAPDGKKFLYTKANDAQLEYRVYNMEKPIPIGENVENIVFTTSISDAQPNVSWYSDSFHLILTENYDDDEKHGKISLIRIDGTNKIEVYNNTLYSPTTFSAPGGDKLIILTSFKSGNQTDLYTIGIR